MMWDEGLDYPELAAMGGGRYGINVVRITVTSSEGGSVSREGCIKSYAGAKETFLLAPEEGYKVGSITVDEKELPREEAEKAAKSGFTFSDLTEDHEMRVSFMK